MRYDHRRARKSDVLGDVARRVFRRARVHLYCYNSDTITVSLAVSLARVRVASSAPRARRDVRLAFVAPSRRSLRVAKVFRRGDPVTVSVSVCGTPLTVSLTARSHPASVSHVACAPRLPLPPRPRGHPRRPARLRPAALGADNTRRLDARRRARGSEGRRREGTALPSRPSPVLPPTGSDGTPVRFRSRRDGA